MPWRELCFTSTTSVGLYLCYTDPYLLYLATLIRTYSNLLCNAVRCWCLFCSITECEDDKTKKDANGNDFPIPENWPSLGAVEGQGVSMSYRYDERTRGRQREKKG